MDDTTMENEVNKPGHETSDAHAPSIFFAGFGLALCCGIILLAMVAMFHALEHRYQAAERDSAARDVIPRVSNSVRGFPEPRLQVSPEVDLATFRAREDEELNHYGWIDKQAKVVRIPLERAIELIAQRGLPYRGQAGAPPPSRTVLDLQQARPTDWQNLQQKGGMP